MAREEMQVYRNPRDGWQIISSADPPWERWDGEGEEAFQAFQTYRDLPVGQRSVEAVATALGGEWRSLAGYKRAWAWDRRARLWDQAIDRQRQQRTIDAQREVAQRHAQIAAAHLSALVEPSRVLAKRIREGGAAALEGMPLPSLYRLAATCAQHVRHLVEAERLSVGLPTDHQAVSAPDGGPVQVQSRTVVDVVRAMYGEAAAEVIEGAVEEAPVDLLPPPMLEVEPPPVPAPNPPPIAQPSASQAATGATPGTPTPSGLPALPSRPRPAWSAKHKP